MKRLGLFRRKCAETETLTATCKANPCDLNVHRDASLAGQPLTSKNGRQLFPRHGCDSRDRWWPVTCTNNDSQVEPLRSFNHPSASRTGFSVLYFCLCFVTPTFQMQKLREAVCPITHLVRTVFPSQASSPCLRSKIIDGNSLSFFFLLSFF